MYFSDIMYETNIILHILQHTLVRSNECRTKAQCFAKESFFQIENTGSKLEENVRICQIMELSIGNWAIMMCTFLIFAHKFGHGTQTSRNLLRIFLTAY